MHGLNLSNGRESLCIITLVAGIAYRGGGSPQKPRIGASSSEARRKRAPISSETRSQQIQKRTCKSKLAGPPICLVGSLISLSDACRTFDRPRKTSQKPRLEYDKLRRHSPYLRQAMSLILGIQQPSWWPRSDLPQALTFAGEGPHRLDLLCVVLLWSFFVSDYLREGGAEE